MSCRSGTCFLVDPVELKIKEGTAGQSLDNTHYMPRVVLADKSWSVIRQAGVSVELGLCCSFGDTC